jgi:hypothetical protein
MSKHKSEDYKIADNKLDYPNIKSLSDISINYYPFVDKKTIIFAMTHNAMGKKQEIKINNTQKLNLDESICGLGDIIRGCIGLYKYAQKKNYYFHIDAQFHILNKYLEIKENPYKDFIKENSSRIKYYNNTNIDTFLDTYNNNEPIFCFTNMCIRDNKISELDKKYMRENFLKPKEIIINKMENLLKNIGINNEYEIVHVRLHDTELLLSKQNSEYKDVYKIIKNYISDKTILLSNSKYFKNYIEENHKEIKQFKTNPGHIGIEGTPEDNIIDTLCEFFIMSKAKKIYTYSDYTWPSHFVQSVNLLFDVPMLNIKQQRNNKSNISRNIMFKEDWISHFKEQNKQLRKSNDNIIEISSISDKIKVSNIINIRNKRKIK